MKTKSLLLMALIAGTGFASAQTTNFVTNPILYIGGSQAFPALDNAALSEYAAINGYTRVAYAGSLPETRAKALLFRRQSAPVVRGTKTIVNVDIINVRQSGSEASLRSAAGNGNQLISFYLMMLQVSIQIRTPVILT